MDVYTTLARRLGDVVSPRSGTASKQWYFTAFVLVITVGIAISHGELVLAAPYLAALAILCAVTVLAFVVPWERLAPGWGAVVPVLDIVAIGLLRDHLRADAVAVSLLTVIPSIWLAARLQGKGIVLGVAAVTLSVTVPSLLRAPSLDSVSITHAVLLPLTVLQIGLLVVGALRRLDGQASELAASLEEKELLLESAATWEQLLESIIDTVDVGIVVVDRDGNDLIMNRAQHRIHELATPEDVDDPTERQLLLQRPGTSVPIPADQRPVRRAVLQETFSNYRISVGAPGSPGTEFSTSARQITDRHGQRSGSVVVFSDITTYLDAVRSQQQFVASVSHELRTPLTSVIGYLELTREEPDLPADSAAYLEVAQRNAEQLLVIVQELLQDQVTRAGSEVLTLRRHRLSALTAQAAESFALRARKEGITLETEVEETPEQPLDQQRMQQVLDNLLANALKYTPRGGTARVLTRAVGSEAVLEVTDTGIGMSDQEQTNLFTDGYRTETARQSGIAGHGLGLALTRRIVIAHGGQISVRSGLGTGSTFTVRLPIDALMAADRRTSGAADGLG